MKGFVLIVLCAGLPALLLSSCFEANIKPKADSLSEVSAGAKADAEGMPAEPIDCQEDERLGSPCSAGKGECQQSGEYVCENGSVVCDVTPSPSADRTELCGTGVDEDCDGSVDEAPSGYCCSDSDCGGGHCVPPEAVDLNSEFSSPGGECTDMLDGGILDDEVDLPMVAVDETVDDDAGLDEMPMDAEQNADSQWEPILCGASAADCWCVRGVCLSTDCADYDPALVAHGVLVNAETPTTGVSVCYQVCQEATDCPAELPVCVEERQIWPDDAARSKGCFAM